MIRDNTLASYEEAARLVRSGGVIAFRTDTFYGLGADPLNAAAVRKIKELKGREENKPILLLISDIDQIDRFIEEPDSYRKIAVQHWPGALTLIGKARPELPTDITAGTNTIGLRLPDDDEVRALVRLCGGALTATSANPAGKPPAQTAAEVKAYFPTGIDLIIDGGPALITEPSTVVDVSGEQPRMIREGAVKRSELSALFK
ncbi:MAG TPA: L-threonylcarbamoyladenylate synthase [Pyrinomonadaceae bacterium]|nr:L-threonylcarbamoyladenylate synthase [Pyrinomonadaceae bacterium]